MTPPWLEPALTALRAAHVAQRLPHALLIHDAGGAGGDWLAVWATQLAVCSRSPQEAPCGECTNCRRAAAGQHPDVLQVRPIDDSKQIRIEQVRDLSQELALTSHQGGFKVGVISPADVLNRYAANALLKTLEEPPARTLLILVASQPSRLPATILSRCHRLAVRAPTRVQSVRWLEALRGPADWDAVLDTLGEAPFFAADADPKAVPLLRIETTRALDELASGSADPAATADRWSRSELALRLKCFENWLTERIRRHFAVPGFSVERRAPVHLPHAPPVTNIRALFELVDGVRELKQMLDAPINRSLALESLLRRLAPGRAAGAAT